MFTYYKIQDNQKNLTDWNFRLLFSLINTKEPQHFFEYIFMNND